MKKLFSLILVALISSQMWAAVNMSVKVRSGQGTAYITYNGTTRSTTNSTAATIDVGSNSNKFTINAVPAAGYRFVSWSDYGDVKYTTAEVKDLAKSPSYITCYMANFELIVTDVTVAVALANGCTGMGTVSGGTTVASGTSVTITATANSNYYFKGWSTANTGTPIVSTNASYTFSASDATYYAVFAAYKTSTVSPTDNNSNTNWTSAVVPDGYVDLGLPSGTLWAKKNLGADSEIGYGSYYAWGSKTAKRNADYTYFTYDNYDAKDLVTSWSGNATYDAATAANASDVTPTKEDWQELLDNCTWNWNAGESWLSNGYVISNAGASIKLPTCGIAGSGGSQRLGVCWYWSSTYKSGTGSTKEPYYLLGYGHTNPKVKEICWASSSRVASDGYAHCGMAIRPIRRGTPAYTLTIRAKVGNDVVVTNTYRCDNGEKVKITVNAPEGYNFVNWADNSSTATTREFTVTANATYNVIYEESVSYVTATFNNWNGSLLEEYTNVESGTTPTYSGSDPTKPADETYTYAFSGWSPELDDITVNTIYTAQFTPTYINYSVTFRTSEDDANPAVKSDYHYGDEITNCPAIDPQKIGDETHTYTFLGWYLDNTETRYEAGMTVSGNMMFTARFEEQIIEVVPVTYNVTIGSFAANGKVIVTSQGNVREVSNTGAVLTFEAGKSLTIQAVPNARYHFDSWEEDAEEEAVIDIRTLNEDMTYTPVFAANEALTLEDTHDEAYYNALYAGHDGEVLTVTMEGRQLTEGSWMTFCVPFDFSIPAGHPFRGAVYAFQNATMSGTNTAAYISLDFRRTYEIKANVPYLIVPTMTTLSDLEFDHVTIEAAPAQETVTAESGQVQFISLPWQTTLINDAQKPDFYLATGNNLRYVKTEDGTTFRAFRAYFHRLVNLGAAARRVVISLDGVETSKEIGMDGEIEDTTRKYMENGVLYIERNGVRYDAQGQRAE